MASDNNLKQILDNLIKKTLEKQMKSYVEGTARQTLMKKHKEYMDKTKSKMKEDHGKKLNKVFGESLLENFKKLMEEEPTNAMGSSSSSQGPIQTFDPLLFIKKAKRKKPVNVEKGI